MSRALGLYPVRINSELVTAQLRDRYYWTNIKTKESIFDIVTDIPQPKDRQIFFKDIIESGQVYREKAFCLLQSESRPEKGAALLKRYKKGLRNAVFEGEKIRTLTKTELCRLQGFADNYCDILSRNKAASLLGDGWNLKVIEHIFNYI